MNSNNEVKRQNSDQTIATPTIATVLASRTLELNDAIAAKDRTAITRILPDGTQLSRDGQAVAPSDEQREFFEEMTRGYEGVQTFVDNGDYASAAAVSSNLITALQQRYLPIGRKSRMFY